MSLTDALRVALFVKGLLMALARLYNQLTDPKKKMEEAEVLRLRRAYFGRCRLCPV